MATVCGNQIFAPLDAANLQDQGLLGPAPGSGAGARRCHKRRLNRSSDEEYGHISLNIRHDSPAAVDAFATIPDCLISRETLHYVGFSDAKANEIWSHWFHWPSTGPRREIDADTGGFTVSFHDFILDRLDNCDDVWEDDDTKWCACMDECGMSTSAQVAIMDREFKLIRMSESCVYWVKDTIEMRYAGLQEIQRASRERDMQFQRAASRPSGGGSGSGGDGRGQVAQHSGGSRGGRSSQRQRSISGLQQENTPGISSEFWNSDTANRVRDNPGYTVLFKGIDLARIPDLFDNDGKLKNIETLLSAPPSDFSGTRSLFYFTADYHVAEYYAAYAKRRAGCESIVIVVLTIAKQVIDDLEEPNILRLYWGPRWKQLVWRSKLQKSLPQPLRKYRNALLTIGHISRGSVEKFRAMESWESLTDDYVLRIPSFSGSNMAVQYVFSGEEEGREFLAEHGKFDVFRLSESDVEALVHRFS
jgi:hypothetical protein